MNITCRQLIPADYPAVRQIITESFADHVGDNPEALSLYTQETWYDPDHLFVAELDGQVVSQLGVRDGHLWCSGIPVPAGLVGTVCTREQYRGRGIGAQLVRFAFTWMERKGLAISSLHTGESRHGFYGRLGYRKAVIEQPRLILNLPGLQLSPEALPVRSATVTDAPLLDALYAACYGRASGAWSRTILFWERRLQQLPKLWSRPLDFRVAGDTRPLAYLAVEETAGAGAVQEFACLPGAEDLAAALLRHTLHNWQERGYQIAELALAATHPLRTLADAFSPEDRTGYNIAFIRIQNRESFLRAVRPLLEKRAHAAGVALTVRLSEDGHAFASGAGSPLRLELRGSDLAALLYNGRRLPGLQNDGGISVQPDDPAILANLFPDTGTCRCSLDAY